MAHLSILRFHPRTRILSPYGSSLLTNCPSLKTLEIHAFDPEMLRVDDSHDFAWRNPGSAPVASSTLNTLPSLSSSSSFATAPSSSTPTSASLSTLSLTGSVLNVLPTVNDAIHIMGGSLDTIDLTAHLDGFLTTEETHRLMDWSTSLSSATIPHLTTLLLHGHLAMTFDAPLLLELCPTLRRFGLTIKSYTSSSFIRRELARVLPRFMAPWDDRTTSSRNNSHKQSFQLKTLELEGPWIVTDQDMDQIAEQLGGLVNLNLVGCRFYSLAPRHIVVEEREEIEAFGEKEASGVEETSPVARLVERLQGTLRTLHIHRRGLEIRPRRDSYDFSDITSATTSSLHLPADAQEPVLAFKRQFPNVKLLIREKQHEHSFVLAPSVETLRRIQHPSPTGRTSILLHDGLSQPSNPLLSYDLSGQISPLRRVRNALPFLDVFRRQKTYSSSGFESWGIRSWRNSGSAGDSGSEGGVVGSWRWRFGWSRRSNVDLSSSTL
ncbi:hypothetical protein BGZ98_003464 [Dissophora globulifera]|nr:hypothetical protein BGZ98_003464 [Dissophora globulifera]